MIQMSYLVTDSNKWVRRYLVLSFFIFILLEVLRVFPTLARYPDIHARLVSAYSCIHFFVAYIFGVYEQLTCTPTVDGKSSESNGSDGGERDGTATTTGKGKEKKKKKVD